MDKNLTKSAFTGELQGQLTSCKLESHISKIWWIRIVNVQTKLFYLKKSSVIRQNTAKFTSFIGHLLKILQHLSSTLLNKHNLQQEPLTWTSLTLTPGPQRVSPARAQKTPDRSRVSTDWYIVFKLGESLVIPLLPPQLPQRVPWQSLNAS